MVWFVNKTLWGKLVDPYFVTGYIENRVSMKISKSDIPAESILTSEYSGYDYMDSYQRVLEGWITRLIITDVGQAFFRPPPAWVRFLFLLRNRLVSVFGLKTPDVDKALPKEYLFEEGEKIGAFRVYDRTENEIVMGEDDKHLSFRVSLFQSENDKSEQIVNITTIVKYNNWFGRFYFMVIKPFHKILAKRMLRKSLREKDARLEGIATDLGNRIMEDLEKKGWKIASEYSNLMFDKGVDFDSYIMRKKDEELDFEWTNWDEWKITGTERLIKALKDEYLKEQEQYGRDQTGRD